VVIALVVAYSAVQLLRKLLPQTAGKLQRALAAVLQQRQWPVVVQRWGRALQPAASPAAGCDSGCSTCNMCATSVAVDKPQAIRIIQ
jgi:hypothetical protein